MPFLKNSEFCKGDNLKFERPFFIVRNKQESCNPITAVLDWEPKTLHAKSQISNTCLLGKRLSFILQRKYHYVNPQLGHSPQEITTTTEYYVPNSQVSFGQNAPAYEPVRFNTEHTEIDQEGYNQTFTAPVYTDARLETENEIFRSPTDRINTQGKNPTNAVDFGIGYAKFKKFYITSTFMASFSVFIFLVQFVLLFAVDLSGFGSEIDIVVNAVITILLMFKAAMFACGSFGYLRKLTSYLFLFTAMMVAHCLLLFVLLMVVSFLAPWVFLGRFMAYVIISVGEAIWFIPLVYSLNRALKKQDRPVELTTEGAI